MKVGLPTKIVIILVLFIAVSWLLFHAHVSTHWIQDRVVVPTAPNDALFGAIEHAKKRLDSTRIMHQQSDNLKGSTDTSSKDSSIRRSNSPKASTTAPKKPKLHAVTYASHHGRDDRFCRSVESAIRHNYELVILGWQLQWKGLSQKLEAAHTYASSIPEDDLLLFTDAFDVLYTAESTRIVDVFLQRNYTILFAAECGCWPHVMDDPKVCVSGYPKSPTPYRYLNSGTWIGYAKYAKVMLADVMREAGNNFGNANDQKLVADMFIAGKHGISLDYQCEVFQSMHRTDPPPLPRCNPYTDLELSPEKRWRNKRTNTYPAIFHFNGGGKEHHLHMEGSVWYKSPSHNEPKEVKKLLEHPITVPSKPSGVLSFVDICTDYARKIHGQ